MYDVGCTMYEAIKNDENTVEARNPDSFGKGVLPKNMGQV
jgi:hypothetical protein